MTFRSARLPFGVVRDQLTVYIHKCASVVDSLIVIGPTARAQMHAATGATSRKQRKAVHRHPRSVAPAARPSSPSFVVPIARPSSSCSVRSSSVHRPSQLLLSSAT
eukprot:8576441-Pyramimonas_sp.AAC.1